ncbi:hypothetical protein K470DRAFT_221495 [Piedraia hortae CBS 480.64]|uniref:HIT-type domain-containing protein n=1 Tax=Piedraia hortae CBS 480.64 TaxID=1314780 RepID=A0A6A7BT61_9PEZI|nr:hypothetical protein K470DRAFT_221495 [Piedraia hortae CBS 480.64]
MLYCQVCHDKESRYKCPVCELRYCCLDCYKIHKPQHAGEVRTEKTVEKPQAAQVPRVGFKGFENDPEFKRLFVRYPILRAQLQLIYAHTLEPEPYPCAKQPWTKAKGEIEALEKIKDMRTNIDKKLADGMKEFIDLCTMRFGQS